MFERVSKAGKREKKKEKKDNQKGKVRRERYAMRKTRRNLAIEKCEMPVWCETEW